MLANPSKKDRIAGVATLMRLDMAASKLLANYDRGLDMGMHCRDVIDLAMLNLSKTEFAKAMTKSKAACGEATLKNLSKVINRLGEFNGLLSVVWRPWLFQSRRHFLGRILVKSKAL